MPEKLTIKEILELYGLLMFNKTPLAYSDKKIYNLNNIRLQIDDLNEFRKFDITYLAGFDIILGLP